MRDSEKPIDRLVAEMEKLREERDKLELLVRRRTAELERTKKEMEQFAYAASHDLREPLRMVSSYMQLLERKHIHALDDTAKEFIYYAADGAKRMNEMIKGLLAYSRVDTRGGEFAPVDCESVLGEVLAGMGKIVENSGARITSGPLPSVLADRRQLSALFENLVNNAIKFAKKDVAPEIRVAADFEADVNEWIFSCRDNGIGVEPRDAERIFVVFQRLHPRGEYEGSGMGLPICKKIVERHGGRIWVESEPGNGSTFFFTIPDASG